MKLSCMKLIDLFGLMYISATKLFESITCGVLFVSSQTTRKSVIPLLPRTFLRNGVTKFTNCARVNSSLNSKSWNLAAVAIDFSRIMNNLRTLILSKADGLLNRVLSPNKTGPMPGNETTGLIPILYKSSRCP